MKKIKITGRAVTQKEREWLNGFAGESGADEITIGYMKMEDETWDYVARFFKEDKLLFYVPFNSPW